MAVTLPEGFKLIETQHSEPETWALIETAFETDEIWQAVFSKCNKNEILPWILSVFPPRWNLPDITFYKVVEESTGRFAGWTALQFPWADRPLTEDQLAIVNSHDLPPMIEGLNMEALGVFIQCLSFANDYGYEPKTDYHRKGTMIHPDFQKRGLGTALTKHCNAISDKTGGKTWVPARPSSNHMFRQCGFKEVGSFNADLKRFGRDPEQEITYMLVREAPNK